MTSFLSSFGTIKIIKSREMLLFKTMVTEDLECSTLLIWIRKCLDEDNKGKWKLFFDAKLEKLGGFTVFRGNLDLNDTTKLAKNLSPFLKEIFEIWSELNYQGSIESVESFLTQSLWHNSLIRIMD